MDYNSTTPILPEVKEAMMPYLTDRFFNPSSAYSYGVEVYEELEEARRFFAQSINAASPDEIIFVSCGSEANNMALRCLDIPEYRIITSALEHHSVLNSVQNSNQQYNIIAPAHDGRVIPKQIKNLINNSNEKCLISCMYINNELGTIQPIEELGKIAHETNSIFHVDAVQAYGKIPIDVQKLNIDMLSVSAHKLGAPRGSGFLYVRSGIPIRPLIYGGQQEFHRRAGTENVAGIIGFKKAIELALKNMENNEQKLCNLKRYIVTQFDKIKFLSIINKEMFTFPSTISIDCGINAEVMLAFLNDFGICVSSGSACNSRDDAVSHVLKAIGLTDQEAGRVIRISFSPQNTYEELDYLTKILNKAAKVLS